ncbi:MAG: hypothetical protein HQK86_11940 [Nitrospinae bacterium]|nr:hypothetical protein [Nitrospinota bacterium]MBF0633549.1 hypothetical protein [Nitrospinota bacterium]
MFEKGKSGNPNGRPKGRPDRRLIYREALEGRASELVEKAISLALEGDTTALKICLDRILPKDAPIMGVELGGDRLTQRAEAIYNATSAGELTPSEAGDLMALLTGFSRVKELDEIEKRLEVLEKRNENETK